MHPQILGLSAYLLLWIVAAALAVAEGYRGARREGFATRPTLYALLLFVLTIVVGAKLQFLLEHAVFPADEPLPTGADNWLGLLRFGFRLPGGILLMVILLPVICRALKIDAWRFADAFVPSVGVAVIFTRLGCFLQGCCFGVRTDGPLGLSFPSGSRVYEQQMLHQDIAWPAAESLPVYPLQLYFVALGVLIYVCAKRWQRTKAFDGQVWLNCIILFFAGTLGLEFVRATTFRLNLLECAAVIGVFTVVLFKSRAAATQLNRVAGNHG